MLRVSVAFVLKSCLRLTFSNGIAKLRGRITSVLLHRSLHLAVARPHHHMQVTRPRLVIRMRVDTRLPVGTQLRMNT